MKTLNIFFIAGFVVSAFACSNNMNDVISDADLEALQAMDASYTNALEANNSLATYVETTGITNDQTCFGYDSVFHQNDSTFGAYHNRYSHRNGGDDHDSGSWTMGSGMNGSASSGGNGGMMGNGAMNRFNSQNCTQSNLDLMDSLMEAHQYYHPED